MTRTVALVYVRVSRLDRGDRERLREDGEDAKLRALSPVTQVAQVKALPALRGLRVEVFEDLHRSGKNTQRPGLERLRERVHDDDVALVAVWSMSRLGRSVRDLYDLVGEIQEAGVSFVSAKESIDTSTAAGRAFFGILGTLAQFERELTSERIAANWKQAAAAGRMIGDVPFGYRRVDRTVSVDEHAAKLIRLVFATYATGRYSYRDLAEWLNTEGHPAPNADGHHDNGRQPAMAWSNDMLKAILRNERYAGRVVYRPRRIRAAGSTDRAVTANFPAIVDEATWSACEALRVKNAAHRGLRYSRTTRYALTGLLRCDRCGGTVHGTTNRSRYAYYVCRARYASRACSQPVARADSVEDQMRDWLAAIRLPPGFTETFAKTMRADSSRHDHRTERDVEKQRRTIDARIARLQELFELGHITRGDYIARREALAAEAATLRPTGPKPEVVADTIASLVDDWPRMDAGQKRQVLETVFVDVTLEDGALKAATPRAGWLPYLEGLLGARASVRDERRRRESNPR